MKDLKKNTPLHLLCIGGFIDIIPDFVDECLSIIDFSVRDKNGQMAFEFCQEGPVRDMLKPNDLDISKI